MQEFCLVTALLQVTQLLNYYYAQTNGPAHEILVHITNVQKFPLNNQIDTESSEIFANSVKRHICDVKNSRLGPDLSTSENNRVISPFREGFIFAKLCTCEISRK